MGINFAPSLCANNTCIVKCFEYLHCYSFKFYLKINKLKNQTARDQKLSRVTISERMSMIEAGYQIPQCLPPYLQKYGTETHDRRTKSIAPVALCEVAGAKK